MSPAGDGKNNAGEIKSSDVMSNKANEENKMAFAGGLLSNVKRFSENESSMFSERLLTAGPRVCLHDGA